MNCVDLAQDRVKEKEENLFTSPRTVSFSQRTLLH
jgi:hypothetical protein